PLVAGELALGAAVLGVDDLVTDLDVEGHAVAVLEAAGTDGQDLALLGLLLGGFGDDQAGRRHLLALARLHDDAGLERLQADAHPSSSCVVARPGGWAEGLHVWRGCLHSPKSSANRILGTGAGPRQPSR